MFFTGHTGQPAAAGIVVCERCGTRWRNDGLMVMLTFPSGSAAVMDRETRKAYWQPVCTCRPVRFRVETVRLAE